VGRPPPSKSVAAMPEDATAKVILRLLLTFVKSKFIRKKCPVPAGAFKKKYSSI